MEINKELNQLGALLLAKSVIDLYPDAQLANYQVNEDGFKYNIKFTNSFSINELNKLKKQMTKNIDRAYEIKYESISKAEALKLFKTNPFRNEIISDSKETTFCIARFGNDFLDMCPKLVFNKLSVIKAISLMNVAGEYWKGNSKNEQLTTITGVVFESESSLKEFTEMMTERKDRDHRRIGQDLELFTFSNLAGQGLPIWLPKGAALIHEIDNYIHDLLIKNDYVFVNTPILGMKQLYQTSGHWDHYRDNMFSPVDIDGDIEILRPMTCPHHLIVYKQKPRSYRELPFRIAEKAILHRYEASGALTGLERVRQMQLIDTHIICTQEQIKDVVQKAYNIINEASNAFGIKIHSVDLSLHDKKDTNKFFKGEALWQQAEAALRQVLESLNIKYKEEVGEAAFYGPKLDMQVKTSLGRIITAYTIQLDFLLPERFELEYIDQNGQIKKPVFVHASVIGTLERFVSILLEQNRGAFALWIAPVQVCVIPVDAQKHGVYCKELIKQLKEEKIRVEYSNSDDRLSKRIRNAQIQKIPYQLVIGDEEINKKTISYREYGKQESHETTIKAFLDILSKQIKDKK